MSLLRLRCVCGIAEAEIILLPSGKGMTSKERSSGQHHHFEFVDKGGYWYLNGTASEALG